MLPPLVKNFVIGRSALDVAKIEGRDGVDIRFRVLENRTERVKVTLRVIRAGDHPPEDECFVIGQWNAQDRFWKEWEVDLFSGTDLPWERDFTIPGWTGRCGRMTPEGQLATRMIGNGEYRVRVEVRDEDGNETNQTYEALDTDLNADEIVEGNTRRRFWENDTERRVVVGPPLNVALVLDRSGSMNLEFASGRSGIQVAKGAAQLFLGILEARNSFRPRLEDKHQAAIVSFAEDVPDDVEISRRRAVFQGLLPVESPVPFEEVLANIEADVAQGRSGWTNIIGGLERAWLVFDPELDDTLNDTNRKHQILLLTDGERSSCQRSAFGGQLGT